MTANEIVQNLKDRKGQHVFAIWSRPAKIRKGVEHVIAKRTQVFIRAGINFANLATVKSGIEKNERGPVQELPWGHWRDGQFPFIIDHNGVEYIRLYPAAFDNLKPSIEWTIDGKPTTFEAVKEMLLASEWPKDEKAECFTVKAESIIEIGEA